MLSIQDMPILWCIVCSLLLELLGFLKTKIIFENNVTQGGVKALIVGPQVEELVFAAFLRE